MVKSKAKDKISLDDELEFMCALRYAIGSHTYISTLCDHFARKYYDKLTDARLVFAAKDIRDKLRDMLWHGPLNFHYAGTVSYDRRKPVEDFIEFMMTLKNPEEDLLRFNSIEVYHENYKEDAPHKYHTSSNDDRNVRNYFNLSDFNDLLCWADLASFFDKKHYKKVTTNYKGNVEEHICIESYIQSVEQIPDKPGYCRTVPWKYEKVYKDVENLKNGIQNTGYYVNDYIEKVEDYSAYEDKN